MDTKVDIKECRHCPNKNECTQMVERRKTYRDTLAEVRDSHAARSGNDRGAYFNGWGQIVALVNKTLGQAKYIVENGDEDLAIEYAQKLSDLFYEYRAKKAERFGDSI